MCLCFQVDDCRRCGRAASRVVPACCRPVAGKSRGRGRWRLSTLFSCPSRFMQSTGFIGETPIPGIYPQEKLCPLSVRQICTPTPTVDSRFSAARHLTWIGLSRLRCWTTASSAVGYAPARPPPQPPTHPAPAAQRPGGPCETRQDDGITSAEADGSGAARCAAGATLRLVLPPWSSQMTSPCHSVHRDVECNAAARSLMRFA